MSSETHSQYHAGHEDFQIDGLVEISDKHTRDEEENISLLVTLTMDVGLLLAEFCFNCWLTHLMVEQGNLTYLNAFLTILLIQTLINGLLWLNLNEKCTGFGISDSLQAVTCFAFPSPVLIYLWFTFKATFGCEIQTTSMRMANTFRIVNAVMSSCPLIILNICSLFFVMEVKDSGASNLVLLIEHLRAGNNGSIHCLAGILSTLNIIRANSLFNEHLTNPTFHWLFAIPFIFSTVSTRLITASVLIYYMDPAWLIILVTWLLIINVGIFLICAKRKDNRVDKKSLNFESVHERRRHMELVYSEGSQIFGGSETRLSCAHHLNNTGPISELSVSASKRQFHQELPKIFALGIGSIFIPTGYSNDKHYSHPPLKGGLFIALNFVCNMLLLGVALNFTMINGVPSTLTGLTFPQPSFKVQVPKSDIKLQVGSLDVAFTIPNSKVELGKLPLMKASFNTSSKESVLSVILPIVMIVINLPFVVTRVAVMELDCVIARKTRRHTDAHDGINGHNGVKTRLCVTICCGLFAFMIFTVGLVLIIVIMSILLLS